MKGRRNMRMEVIHGSRTVPRAEQHDFLVSVSDRVQAGSAVKRQQEALRRNHGSPERQSFAVSMLAVEDQLVRALWTIARQSFGKAAPLRIDIDGDIQLGKCGLDYLHDEKEDIYARYYDAKAGKYWSPTPRQSAPKAGEISTADRVQQWLLLVPDEFLRKILLVGATTKSGDVGRQVNWDRVKFSLPETKDMKPRTLRFKYRDAIRLLVLELRAAKIL